MAPKQTDPQFKLRMTPEIKDAIEKAAIENNRSMNAEILARLEQTLRYDPNSDRVQISKKQVDMLAATFFDRLTEAGLLRDGVWQHTGSKPGETANPSAFPGNVLKPPHLAEDPQRSDKVGARISRKNKP